MINSLLHGQCQMSTSADVFSLKFSRRTVLATYFKLSAWSTSHSKVPLEKVVLQQDTLV